MPDPGRLVYLGMPGYSSLTGDAARGYWRATRLPESQVYYGLHAGSLLAANFNALWAGALNFALMGRAPHYFAMQHADIGPEDWWLDTLIDEMEARGLDVLGVVAPIKDMMGVTSVALERPDRDTWKPLCRLTMGEIFRLPVTFTSDDTGHPLLLNTGLWVCKFDPAWAKTVSFTINDRIVFDESRKQFVAQCEPEDWNFSRQCHALGLKIGCTRKVKLQHRGEHNFPNDRVWGHEYDVAWADESQLPKDPEGFVFPVDIDGWLYASEGKALSRLAKDKRVLEIGSYCGLSTVCMARTANHVTTYDTHDGRGTPYPRDTYQALIRNLERYGVADKVAAVRDELTRTYGATPNYDLAFIDGAHDAESVSRDAAIALKLLRPGGLLAFHDYTAAYPGVTSAVADLVAQGGRIVSVVESLAVVQPPAAIPLEV